MLSSFRSSLQQKINLGSWDISRMACMLEAAGGIEPPNKGFADLCLTTWLRRHKKLESGKKKCRWEF
jgi:hypothetical protein